MTLDLGLGPKMIFYPVILFILCWQCSGGENIEDLSIESILDQVAVPTKIKEEFFQKPVKTSPTKKYTTNERVESSTIHYENSNGFVPLIISTQPYEVKQKRRDLGKNYSESINGTKSQTLNAAENDPRFSTEARIFFNLPNPSENRRAFTVDNTHDEFELLKVSNGTPAVANYNTFFDRSRDPVKPDHPDVNYKKTLRNKDRERGKRIQSYLGSYDATNQNNQQYVHSETKNEKTKNVYQPEITRNHYRQEISENYRAQKVPTLPKTNYASLTTQKPTIKTYTPQPQSKKNEEYKFKNPINAEYKFKSPIMVEPSEYKVDIKFNGQSAKSVISTSNPQNDIKNVKEPADQENESSDHYIQNEGTNRNYESADSRDFSEENPEYMDEMEKPRRIQKTSRRRPYHFDSSRKLPKEHREVYDDVYDDHGRRRPNTRSKSRYRPKTKPVQIITEDDQYDNEGDNTEDTYNNSNNQENFNDNTWNQVAPNIEVSHSNGYEVNQIEKPKLHLVPVNILSNFDHATALDNSQGFDISNAMFTGYVQEGSMVSTPAPLMSSTSNFIDQNLIPSSTAKPQITVSSSIPDVIVGQSSFQNPIQAVLMPNKLHQYVQSTMSPAVFAVTPRPDFTASSTVAPNVQQMLNQVQASFPINQQIITAQPTRQSFTNLLHPVQSNNQFYVNSNGLQGQNSYSYQNIQSTTSRPHSDGSDTSHKKKFNGNNGQFLASASLSVGHRQSNNKDNGNKKSNNNNDDYNYNSNSNHRSLNQNLNTLVQPTVVPAILHTGYGLISNQNPQLVQNPLIISNIPQNALENSIKQLQYNILNNRYQLSGIPGVDNIGGASSNVNTINNLVQKAHLPILGAKNVEIINPNLNANAYAVNQIPATLVTTPIPLFTTSSFVTPKQTFSTTMAPPVSVQNFVDSLTEIGTKRPNTIRNINSFINLQGADRPLYNPINFVPNYDLIKSQSVLNNNIAPADIFSQQNLNLVPLVPGGNFYKHSQGAQINLYEKPKLSSDLEKYAEEMFKESLRTIYNSHKWNSDSHPKNISLVDNSELAKLRNELLRIKNNIRDSKGSKDVLEGHYTENKIRAVKPGSDYKRPDSSREEPYKKPHHHHHHHPHHHHHQHKHKHNNKINDYLTPPRLNSFISKSPFHDKPPPKKRPGHGSRPHHQHEHVRPRPRQGVVTSSPKFTGSEAQASSYIDYRYPLQSSRQEKNHYSQPDYQNSYNNYPSFTTTFPEGDLFKSSAEYKSSSIEKDFYDINHQRTHNLMGLLMKNKQLPQGVSGDLYSDGQIGKFYDDENSRTQTQTYEDILRSFQQKSDNLIRPIPLSRISRRNYGNLQIKV